HTVCRINLSFLYYRSALLRAPHSFPTRRSSDLGVGVTMTLPMDIRLASTNAKFGFVFARRGITMEACSSWFLPRLVGPQQTKQEDRKSTRLNSSHVKISYAVFCLKKKKITAVNT